MSKKAAGQAPAIVLLPGFSPISILWDGDQAVCPSETSARWMLRMYRAELNSVEALALWRGRIFVHRERFASVMAKAAIDAIKRRATVDA